MSELHTIEAHVVSNIKDERIATDIPECPLSSEARRFILSQCPIVITAPYTDQQSLPFTQPADVSGTILADLHLKQTSGVHNRSFELKGPPVDTLWHDEYGNEYSSITLKGNNFSNPGVIQTLTATDGFIAWGLQESKIIERVIKASNVMRARGIGTEFIMGLAEPKAYAWPTHGFDACAYEMIPLADYKARIVASFWKSLDEKQRQELDFTEVLDSFNDKTFFVSMRATDTPYRLGDVHWDPAMDVQNRKDVYDHINVERVKQGEQPLNPNSMDDWSVYVINYLAPKLAQNLGKLHPDLAHRFLHADNITALGSIVDNDSVHGDALGLGDEPITAQDRARDILDALNSLHLLLPLNKSSEQIELLAGFIETYFVTLESAIQDDIKTRTILSDIMYELYRAKPIVSIPFEIPRNKVIDIFGATFYGTYFRADTEVSRRFSEFSQAYLGSLDTFVNQHKTELFEAMQQYLGVVAQAIIEEYSLQLDTVEPGNGKTVFDSFKKDTSVSAAYDELTVKLTQVMQILLSTHWGKLFDQYFTGSDTSDSEHERGNLYDAYVWQQTLQVEKLAYSLIPELLEYYQSELIDLAECTVAMSAFPEYESTPCIGPKQGFLWQSTTEVPYEVANKYFADLHPDGEYVSLDTETNPMYITVVVPNGDELQEVVSDGAFSSTSYEIDGTNEIEITIEQADDSNPLYVMVITKDSDNQTKATMYVPARFADNLNDIHKIGLKNIVARLSASSDEKQDLTLF
jgi:hypothetical protein